MIRRFLIRILERLTKEDKQLERQKEAYRLARFMYLDGKGRDDKSDRADKHSSWWYEAKKYKNRAREFYGLPIRKPVPCEFIEPNVNTWADHEEFRTEEKIKRLK